MQRDGSVVPVPLTGVIMRTIFVVLLVLGSCFGQTSEFTTPSNRDRARRFLEDSLKDKNPDTRKHAVQALGLVSPREPYLSQLEAMLDDKDVEVRAGCDHKSRRFEKQPHRPRIAEGARQ